MAQLQEGHSQALAVLFVRYHRLVLRIAFRILRDQGEAEDLTQSVFLQLFRSAAQYDESRGTAKAWILRSAYHRSFNQKEYLILRGFYEEPRQLLPSQQSPPRACEHSLDGPESIRALQQAFGHLSDAETEIVKLSVYEGLTMREISRKTGQSFASVRHHYYRSLETLRSVLSETPNPTDKTLGEDRRVHVKS